MPFNSEALRLTDEERVELEQMKQSRTLAAGDVFRARLILMLAEGVPYRTIQERLDTTAPTISRWKERFVKERMAGLLRGPTPGPEADGDHAGVAGQSLRCDTPKAEGWIDSLVVPQTSCTTRNRQRHGATHLAAGRFEAASIGALYGQR